MGLSDAEVVDLLERASSVWERLEGGFELGEATAPRVEARWDRWRRQVARGDAAGFARVLEWQGLEAAAARRALAPPRWLGGPRPGWLDVVADVLEAVSPVGAEERERVAPGGSPWADVLVLFVRVARARLGRGPLDDSALFGPGVAVALERTLGRWLAFLSYRTLELEASARALRERRPDDRALREQMAQDLAEGRGLPELLTEYAVLARQSAVLVERWVEVTRELVTRFAADRDDIVEHLAGGVDPGPVTAVETGLSDPHRGGRSVISLTARNGLRVIYKPRDVSMDLAWNDLLGWFADRGAPLKLHALAMLARPGYAWVEYLEHRRCADMAGLRDYCRRAGALLFVAYLLDATDMHDGNLIAAAERGPVLIDLETLLEPQVRPLHGSPTAQATRRAEALIHRSAQRTAMLPTWRRGPGDAVVDIGGLGSLLGSASTPWYHRTGESSPHPPEIARALEGPDARPLQRELVGEVVAGFAETYRFAAERRDDLAAADGPLAAFRGRPVRFLYRDTQVYMKLLESSFEPGALRDGADRTLALEGVKRVLDRSGRRPFYLPLVVAEARSLADLDVPYFESRTDSTSLFLENPEGEVRDFFVAPSHDSAVQRARELGEADLEVQLETVRLSFELRLAASPHGAETARADAPSHPEAPPLGGDAARGAALELARVFAARAVRGDDGSATWVAPVQFGTAPCFQIAHTPVDLGSGAVGAAVFLAAVERVAPGSGAGPLALAALEPLRRAIRAPGDFSRGVAWSLGLGGGSGWGSVVWGLVRVAELLGAEVPLEMARVAATAVSPERLGAIDTLDVYDGVSGALLGLLALAGADPDGDGLDRAAACGRRLLSARAPDGSVAPRGGAGGFGFGPAGVAWALARLHDRLGDPELREAAAATARAAAAAPLDGPPATAREASWCHGSAGSALALALLSRDGLASAADALRHAEHASRPWPGGLDSPCCGRFGRLEALEAVARVTGRRDLAERVRRAASEGLERSAREGAFRIIPEVSRPLFAPGLLLGVAGIGYTLLRLSGRDDLPCALLLE